MVRIVTRARRICGQVRVPGELPAALRAAWLAAISAGVSRIQRVPTRLAPQLRQLRRLGVDLAVEGDTVSVTGVGLRGLRPDVDVDLSGLGRAALPALAILAMQPSVRQVRIDASQAAPAQALFRLLARTGSVARLLSDTEVRLDGVQAPAAADHAEADLDPDTQLALLCAGLFAGDGALTTVRQRAASRERPDTALVQRGLRVEPNRREDPGLRAMILTAGTPQSLDVDLPGDLELALPFLVAALIVGRSELTIERISVRPGNRTFLDLLRQIKGEIKIIEAGDACDLLVKGSHLKGTRVADPRAQRLLDQVPLLAVLATQTEGEFIIRDVEALHQVDGVDLIAHLVTLLRGLGAKVGEYPEGFVVDGARPLRGTPIQTLGRATIAQAFAVAGLVSAGDMQLDDGASVDAVFPGFFDTLDSITVKERK